MPDSDVRQAILQKFERVRDKLNEKEQREFLKEINKAQPNAGKLAEYLQR